MEQHHSGEANIPQTLNKFHVLWNLRIIYCVYHSLPLVPVLRQMNPVMPFLISILTIKNRASYIQDGRTATLQMLHFIYFFSNKYKY
jgi:hypothetical protein